MLSDREKAIVLNGFRSFMKSWDAAAGGGGGDIDQKLLFVAEVLQVPEPLLEEMRIEHRRFLQQICGAGGWRWPDGD